MNQPILEILKGNNSYSTPPIWLMRQAGRYLPEYLKTREKAGDFLKLCYNPKFANEVTLQPIKRFAFDASIIFSDILVIPHAMGQDVSFIKGKGPVLGDLDIEKLDFNLDFLKAVYEAIKLTRATLPLKTTLIGFSGAPWTLATYMLEKGTSKDFLKVKEFAYKDSKQFDVLLNKLCDAVALHLIEQAKNGAQILQIFDSWAGILTPSQFQEYSIKPTKSIVNKVKEHFPDIPIIGFARGAGVKYKEYAEYSGVDAISFDQFTPPKWIYDNIKIPVQGNLDPVLLMTNKQEMIKQVKLLKDLFKDKPYIFNLGHGILPSTPIENVHAMIDEIRRV